MMRSFMRWIGHRILPRRLPRDRVGIGRIAQRRPLLLQRREPGLLDELEQALAPTRSGACALGLKLDSTWAVASRYLKSAPVTRAAWRIAPVTAGVVAVGSTFIVGFASAGRGAGRAHRIRRRPDGREQLTIVVNETLICPSRTISTRLPTRNFRSRSRFILDSQGDTPMSVSVRYIVNDVDAAIVLYAGMLGFREVDMHPRRALPRCPAAHFACC